MEAKFFFRPSVENSTLFFLKGSLFLLFSNTTFCSRTTDPLISFYVICSPVDEGGQAADRHQ